MSLKELSVERSFIKGLELSKYLYDEAVNPILSNRFPDLPYSAALIGPGSDVLGFDTPQSMDHDWGPRLLLFLSESDWQTRREEIDRTLARELPGKVHGFPVGFGLHSDGTTVMADDQRDPVRHGIRLLTIRSYFTSILGFDPTSEIRAGDWVSVPQHHLLILTSGRVFHDGLGQLEPLRARLGYYPDPVWLYLLAVQWRRIAQEEAFMGRCGQVGDELGSRLVAARLVRDLVKLCFLMEKKYAPYVKWLGRAFAQLSCADYLVPAFTRVLQADTWEERQERLVPAYEFVAAMHNDLGITRSLSTRVSPFYNRPFLVLHADRFVDAIRAAITSEEVRRLPEHLGSIDQFVDSTDAINCFTRFGPLFD